MDYLKIGSFLQRLRKEKGMTQAQVAEMFDVSFKTISKWECGESLPEIPLLSKVAKYYGVTIDEIIKGQRNDEQVEAIQEYISTSNKIKVKQHLNRLTLSFTISMAIICLGFLLIYILGYTTNRSDLGSLIPLGVLFVGIVTYFIGNVAADSKQLVDYSEQDNSLIKKRKSKFNFWFILISVYIGLCCLLFYIFPRMMLDYYGSNIIINQDPRYWVITIEDFIIMTFLLALLVGIGPFIYFFVKRTWYKPLTKFIKKYKVKVLYFIIFLIIYVVNSVFIRNVVPYLGDSMPVNELYGIVDVFQRGPKATSVLLNIYSITMIITGILFIFSLWNKKIFIFELISLAIANSAYVLSLIVFRQSSSVNPYKVAYYNYPFYVSLGLIVICLVLTSIIVVRKMNVKSNRSR